MFDNPYAYPFNGAKWYILLICKISIFIFILIELIFIDWMNDPAPLACDVIPQLHLVLVEMETEWSLPNEAAYAMALCTKADIVLVCLSRRICVYTSNAA